jgi:NADPH:quinone reductase-like Zn-dependent oxidoreductase
MNTPTYARQHQHRHHTNRKAQHMATTSAQTMRAILQDAYGTTDVWRVGEIAVPEYSDKEVLVKVEAAGLDRGTWHLMTGLPYLGRLAFGLRRPKNPVPGRDLAGTVVAVGEAVTRFEVGDPVFGIGAALSPNTPSPSKTSSPAHQATSPPPRPPPSPSRG